MKNSLRGHHAEGQRTGARLVRCPFCDSSDTRRESDFGTTLAYAQYYCLSCRTVFEWVKWEEGEDDASLPDFLRGGN